MPRPYPIYNARASSALYGSKFRDYALFAICAALLLVGCVLMAKNGALNDARNVSKFLMGAGVAVIGFMISWYCVSRWAWAVFLVAIVARLLMLSMEPGADFHRYMWDGKLLSADSNPYMYAPDAPEVIHLRDDNWERLARKDQASVYPPATLFLFASIEAVSDGPGVFRAVFFVGDLMLCLILLWRFGLERSILYLWNPLAIYCLATVHFESVFLLPLAIGYALWDHWVEKRGGPSIINANGGIHGGLGQMVCFASFLIGVSVSIKLISFPILLWIVWRILKKAGFKAGFVVLLVGALPILAPYFWAAYVLDASIGRFLSIQSFNALHGVSFFPEAIGRISGGYSNVNVICFALFAAIATYSLIVNESLRRFANIYLAALLLLSPFVPPWHFLWMTPFAIAAEHPGYRMASLFGFAYIGITAGGFGDSGALDWLWSTLYWLPFVIGSFYYAFKVKAREDGFYVRSL